MENDLLACRENNIIICSYFLFKNYYLLFICKAQVDAGTLTHSICQMVTSAMVHKVTGEGVGVPQCKGFDSSILNCLFSVYSYVLQVTCAYLSGCIDYII